MTCIAWDGHTLAADKRSCMGGMVSTVSKLFRLSDGRMAAGAGDFGMVQEMVAWLNAGADPKTFPEAQRRRDDFAPVLVISLDGRPAVYEMSPHPIRYDVSQVHIAIGSGREFARAAMFLGRDAREAVAVACALDSGCGNGIDSMTLAAA